MADATRSGGAGKLGVPPPPPAPPRGPRCTVTSGVSPGLFLQVLARLGENGCEREVVRCVRLCRDTWSNAQLWERVVDLQHTVVGHDDEDYRATRLIHWAEVGDLVRVREMLARGADVDARDCHGRTALLHASRSGHTAVVSELAARGADVNAWMSGGMTPLIWACFGGYAATATALLRLGADVNAQGNGGVSALTWAAINDHVAAVRVLLAAPGIDVNLIGVPLARIKGRAAVVALLDAAGAR